MLFWIFVILLIIGIIILNFTCHDELGLLIIVLSAFAIVASLIAFIVNYTTSTARLEANKEKYKAIMYKAETESYYDEFGLLNKDVIDEIQKWNEDLVFNQEMQDNFWLGIYIPNIYDEFETIDYKTAK